MAAPDEVDVTPNGSTPKATGTAIGEQEAALASLRTQPDNVHLFRGYGPLVVGVILFVLMVTLAPTVAPERIVERPVQDPSTETTP